MSNSFDVALSEWEQSLIRARGAQNGRTIEEQLAAMIHRELNRMARSSVPGEIFNNSISDINDRRKNP